MSRRERQQASATYGRSYLVTFGLLFAGLGVLFWPGPTADVGTDALLVMGLFFAGGLGVLLLGLLGPDHRMERWADALSTHEVSLVIMLLAYPVYLLLAPFYRRR